MNIDLPIVFTVLMGFTTGFAMLLAIRLGAGIG